MKNRREEMRVCYDLNNLFGKEIIPMIEVIKDDYKKEYEIDLETGDFVYESKGDSKRRSRKIKQNSDENIITLTKISNILNHKTAFIDFFRFSDGEYKDVDFNKVELSLKFNNDFEYYKKRVLELLEYPNFIPVINIKKNFESKKYEIVGLVKQIKDRKKIVALRISDNIFNEYLEILNQYLDVDDFFMLDLRNSNIRSKEIELLEFSRLTLRCKKIVLHSPRSLNYKNGNYEDEQFTQLIDNSLQKDYLNHNFYGVGNYGGLKDELPKKGGSKGIGSALALLYFKKYNKFFSLVCNDTSQGIRGYIHIRDRILNDLSFFDPKNNCPAIKRIRDMRTSAGTWSTWINICLTRYINEISQEV